MDPVISFRGYTIETLNYSKGSYKFTKDLEIKEGLGINLSVNCGITENLKNGQVILKVQLREDERDLNIVLEVHGDFEINNISNEEEIKNYLAVNGTAILYPYIRSILSMVSSLDSERAIVLPTINTNIFRD